MSDGIAPAIDKVGPPEPRAPEAQAAAPTLNTVPPPFVASQPSAPTVTEPKPDGAVAPEPKPTLEHLLKKPMAKPPTVDGAGPAVAPPKPVEVMSVPETPVNGSTPAGGTPRPELDIPTEPAQANHAAETKSAVTEPVVLSGIQEPKPTPVTSSPKIETATETKADEPNGQDKPANAVPTALNDEAKPEKPQDVAADKPAQESMKESGEKLAQSLAGEKRKFEEAPPSSTVLPVVPTELPPVETDRPEKKAKLNAEPPKTDGVNGGSAPKKPGRPKKEKKPPVVGRTARKTRSQGPVEL